MEPLRDHAFGDNGSETGWGKGVPGNWHLSLNLTVYSMKSTRMIGNCDQDGVEWCQHSVNREELCVCFAYPRIGSWISFAHTRKV